MFRKNVLNNNCQTKKQTSNGWQMIKVRHEYKKQ